MRKCVTTVSIECDLLQQARIRNINISKASQEGIEQALNIPFSWEDLSRERLELKQKLKIIDERMKELQHNYEFVKDQKAKIQDTLKDSVDLIINRHEEQPPVPEVVWEKQAKLNNMTTDELQLIVNKRMLELGRDQIER